MKSFRLCSIYLSGVLLLLAIQLHATHDPRHDEPSPTRRNPHEMIDSCAGERNEAACVGHILLDAIQRQGPKIDPPGPVNEKLVTFFHEDKCERPESTIITTVTLRMGGRADSQEFNRIACAAASERVRSSGSFVWAYKRQGESCSDLKPDINASDADAIIKLCMSLAL